ncbi:hypothetical protein C8Q79DRAFT_946369, partial [Trametes meyenii]
MHYEREVSVGARAHGRHSQIATQIEKTPTGPNGQSVRGVCMSGGSHSPGRSV